MNFCGEKQTLKTLLMFSEKDVSRQKFSLQKMCLKMKTSNIYWEMLSIYHYVKSIDTNLSIRKLKVDLFAWGRSKALRRQN